MYVGVSGPALSFLLYENVKSSSDQVILKTVFSCVLYYLEYNVQAVPGSLRVCCNV